MNKLIEEAIKLRPVTRNSKTRHNYNQEEFEFVIAWIKKEITGSDICRVRKFKPTNRASVYNYITSAIRIMYEKGIININEELLN